MRHQIFRPVVLFAAVSFSIHFSAFISETRAEKRWNVRDHVPLERFVVQSHRGAGDLSPENSLEAFDIGWAHGTIPEADIRLTRDGVIVAFHDNNFKRILPTATEEMKQKGIADLTLEEVKALDIGKWKGEQYAGQRVPTMKEVYEVLKRHPERRLYIDIKNVDFEQLAKESEGYHQQLILASTKYDQIRLWKHLAPKSFTLHWMGGKEEALAERFAKLRETHFADIDQLQIHVQVGKDGRFSPSDEFLLKAGEELRKHGILFQTLPWGRHGAEVYHRLMDLGCASFATDHPDETMAAIREYYGNREPGSSK